MNIYLHPTRTPIESGHCFRSQCHRHIHVYILYKTITWNEDMSLIRTLEQSPGYMQLIVNNTLVSRPCEHLLLQFHVGTQNGIKFACIRRVADPWECVCERVPIWRGCLPKTLLYFWSRCISYVASLFVSPASCVEEWLCSLQPDGRRVRWSRSRWLRLEDHQHRRVSISPPQVPAVCHPRYFQILLFHP